MIEGSWLERPNIPDVRFGEVDVVVVVWWEWCVEWRLLCNEGDEERRREKREGLRAGVVVVAGGGVGSRREKRGMMMDQGF